MRPHFRSRRLRLVVLGLLALGGASNCQDKGDGVHGLRGAAVPHNEAPEECGIPLEGCPCPTDGASVDCGETVREEDGRLICSVGKRSCEAGSWGACVSSRFEEKSVHARTFGLRPLGLGERDDCPDDYENVECDPYCNAQVDVPDDDIELPPSFDVTDEGLTILPTGVGNCDSIELHASSETLTVTSFEPVTALEGNPLNLWVTATPPTCLEQPFVARYTVNQPDRAFATGTLSDNGRLTLRSGVAGPLVVTAYGGGFNDSLQIDVRIRVVDTAGVSPDVGGAGFYDAFYAANDQPETGSATGTAVWLYPYAETYFPLGLLPPVVQYKYSDAGDTTGTAGVRLSLRFPADASYDASTFDYALVLTETNSVHQGLGKAAAKDPQLVIPPSAWDAFEETARGNDATLSVERLRGDGTLEAAVSRNIHFVDAQLKGSVLYSSYNSTIAGSTSTDVTGGVLRVEPGENQPEVAVPVTAGKCSTCHTASSDGSTLVLASGDAANESGCSEANPGSTSGSPNESWRGNSCSFDIDGSFVDEIDSYPKTTATQFTFAWAGLYPDGSFAFTNAWNNMGSDTGDKFLGTTPQGSDYRSSSKIARIWDGRQLSSVGAPNMAVTPAFSHDGRKMAFNPSSFPDFKRDVMISEVGACQRFTPGTLVISEVSACRSFGGTANAESIEIRNDSAALVNMTGYTIRGGSDGTTICNAAWPTTSCGSQFLDPGEVTTCTRFFDGTTSTNCLNDDGGKAQLYTGAGVAVASTLTQNWSSCVSTVRRGYLSCSGNWSAGAFGYENGEYNDVCSRESVEIRNDAGQSVDVTDWSVWVNGEECARVPNTANLAMGAVIKLNATVPDCFPDDGDAIVRLLNSEGSTVDSREYTTSCTSSAPTHQYLDCSHQWLTTTSSSETSNDNCTGLASYTGDAAGDSLVVMDFSCGQDPGDVRCESGVRREFTDARTVASGAAMGYPSFLPDNEGVVFHRTVNAPDFAGESALNSIYGGSAEIWLTSADNDDATSPFAPIRLNKLNGYNEAGTDFFQTTIPRDLASSAIPNYDNDWHSGVGAAVGWHYDQCNPSGLNQDTVREGELNYFPAASPQEAGDQYWVLFTSRRLYGNVATSSPWQAERSNVASNRFGPYSSGTCENALGPGSGFIETKKLWVSAIDKDWSSGSDPSHPAFYLPGQELRAGNSHAYWVATPCSELDDACDTDDDCCDGTGASPEVQCRIMDTSPSVRRECRAIDSCSEQDEECSDSIPCCDGLVCPPEGGVCFAEVAAKYEQQTYRREFIAKCPVGLHPKWLEFEWQALIETGTSIDFGIQTRPDEDTNYEPSPPLHYGSATVTTPDGQWDTRNAQNPTVDKLLTDNDLLSQEYLLVTMTFKPNLDETRAPTLRNWRQIYDCIPAE